MKEIYLDHHTATYLDADVLKEMQPFFNEKWGSLQQLHGKGQELLNEASSCYHNLYKRLNADLQEDDVLFTSSKEEAISHVFKIAHTNAMGRHGKNHFLTLATEDAAILMNLNSLEKQGCKFNFLPQHQNGTLKVDEIAEAITPRTAMVSVSLAHGLTGVVQPLEKLKELCRLRGIYLHVDVTYALGKMNVDFEELGADFVTFGGEFIHGPKSSGVLIVRSGIKVTPLIYGGLEQKGYRGGALDMAHLKGLSIACSKAVEQSSQMCLEVASTRDYFEDEIKKHFSEAKLLFTDVLRLPNTLVVSFPSITADAVAFHLNAKKVCVSLGGVHFQKLSHMLAALKYEPAICNGVFAMTLSLQTTYEDVDAVIQLLKEIVEDLNKLNQHEVPHDS